MTSYTSINIIHVEYESRPLLFLFFCSFSIFLCFYSTNSLLQSGRTCEAVETHSVDRNKVSCGTLTSVLRLKRRTYRYKEDNADCHIDSRRRYARVMF